MWLPDVIYADVCYPQRTINQWRCAGEGDQCVWYRSECIGTTCDRGADESGAAFDLCFANCELVYGCDCDYAYCVDYEGLDFTCQVESFNSNCTPEISGCYTDADVSSCVASESSCVETSDNIGYGCWGPGDPGDPSPTLAPTPPSGATPTPGTNECWIQGRRVSNEIIDGNPVTITVDCPRVGYNDTFILSNHWDSYSTGINMPYDEACTITSTFLADVAMRHDLQFSPSTSHPADPRDFDFAGSSIDFYTPQWDDDSGNCFVDLYWGYYPASACQSWTEMWINSCTPDSKFSSVPRDPDCKTTDFNVTISADVPDATNLHFVEIGTGLLCKAYGGSDWLPVEPLDYPADPVTYPWIVSENAGCRKQQPGSSSPIAARHQADGPAVGRANPLTPGGLTVFLGTFSGHQQSPGSPGRRGPRLSQFPANP